MQDHDLREAVKAITLMKRVMKCIGSWPESTFFTDVIFIFTVIYLSIHCFLSFIEVGLHIRDVTYVVACSMEIGFIFLALVKIVICKIKRKLLITFLDDIKEDFAIENYKTMEERMAFLSYNNLSRKYSLVTLVSCWIAASFYFFMSLVANVEMMLANSSYGFKTPYKVWLWIEPSDAITYACVCCYQYYVVLCLVFGYVATDCFVVTLALHVSGLFSALSCKVKQILDDPRDRQRRMKKLIVRHIRIIRLAEYLEDSFNMVILVQVIGSTLQFCAVGYDALVSSADGEAKLLFTFFLIVICIFTLLLTYCYIGECLINESSFLGDCFYQCEWYNISRTELKLMHICMMRSTKQLRLTSGKFCTLSLNTFSDVLKTSMAYFSVLRSFL